MPNDYKATAESAVILLRRAADALEAQPPKLRDQYVATLRLYADEPWRLCGHRHLTEEAAQECAEWSASLTTPPASMCSCMGCEKASAVLLPEVHAAERDRHCERPTRWQVRHVESGVVVPCRDHGEAEAHVRESVSGPWVAEVVISPGERT